MARVFLDVGAHVGETARVVLKPRHKFDRVVCFEPAPVCWPDLDSIGDPRLEVVRAGLWHEDATLTLHDPGDIGASIHAEKALGPDVAACAFLDAATWFREQVDRTDTVYLKINCEGAECAVLDRLLTAGQLAKIDHMVVHFDVRKIASQAALEPAVRAALSRHGIRYYAAEQILCGRSYERKVENWLDACQAADWMRWRHTVAARYEFAARRRLYPAKVALMQRLGRDRRARPAETWSRSANGGG